MHKFLCIYNNFDEFKLAIVFAKDEEHARVQFLMSNVLIDCVITDKDDVVDYLKQVKDSTFCDESEGDESPRYCGVYVYIYNLDDIIYSKTLNYNNELVNLKDLVKHKLLVDIGDIELWKNIFISS